MYPSNKQTLLLLEILDHHRLLYNSALQERIGAFKLNKTSVSYLNQAAQLSEIREEFPDYKKFNAQSQQRTLKRLDRAFQNFFRRCKSGETPGFPRFKPKAKFNSFGFNSHGDGYKLLPNGKVRISKVGEIKLRGKSKYMGEPKEAQISVINDKWYLSVTIDTETRRTTNESEYDLVTADWGTKTLLTLAQVADISLADKIEYKEIANPKILQKAQEKLSELQAKKSKATHKSSKHRKLSKQYRTLSRKVRNIREDFQHKVSNKIALSCRGFVTEKLNVKSMVEGRVEILGKNNKGLHRNILDSAPSELFSKIRYKVEETGSEYRELETRILKPTQRCSECWEVEKKDLSIRIHKCRCGYVEGRDKNTVRVMVREYKRSQELALVEKSARNHD
jgi:putative transposase